MSNQIDQLSTNQEGHLQIGGVDSLELVKKYQTPLVVYDVKAIRDQIHHFQKVFQDNGVDLPSAMPVKHLPVLQCFN